MKPSIRIALISALLAGALAACGGSPTASEPTAAPQPAAAAPTSSTQTESRPKPTAAAEPEATAAPEPTAEPAAASSGDTTSLADAMENAKNIKTYRMEMEMSSSGLLDAMAQAGGSTAPAGADVPLMSMTGEFDNGSAHFTMKGLFAGFLGIEPDKGLEMMTVDGKSYVHGPVPMMGATEDAWYVTEQGQSAAPAPVDSAQFFEAFGGKDLSKFEKVGDESLDGVSCGVYKGDEEATQAAFESASGGGNGMDEIESAELKIWACDDGYVHQMLISATGSSEDDPDQKIDFKMNFHLYDFDSSDIEIVAPENAQTLQTPSFEMPTTQP